MGNSASVTVGNIKLSIAEAAQLEDQIKAMPEVKAYREQQAEAKRIKSGDWVNHPNSGNIFRAVIVDEVNVRSGHGFCTWTKSECIKITDPDEIATLNRIAARMGG
jgi:hypothetical protein